MMDLTDIKDFMAVCVAAGSIGGALLTIGGIFVLTKWRILRLEKAVFGNGEKGLRSRTEQLERDVAVVQAKCDERSRKLPTPQEG